MEAVLRMGHTLYIKNSVSKCMHLTLSSLVIRLKTTPTRRSWPTPALSTRC